MVRIDFEHTLAHALRGKLHNWRRRTGIRYAAAAGMCGLAAHLFGADLIGSVARVWPCCSGRPPTP